MATKSFIGTENNLWSNANNWDGGKPGPNDIAIVDGANCTVDESPINVAKLQLLNYDDRLFDLSGVTLNCSGDVLLDGGDEDDAELDISNATINMTGNGIFRIDNDWWSITSTNTLLIVDGAVVDFEIFDYNFSALGELRLINGATLNAIRGSSSTLTVNTFTMSGGSVFEFNYQYITKLVASIVDIDGEEGSVNTVRTQAHLSNGSVDFPNGTSVNYVSFSKITSINTLTALLSNGCVDGGDNTNITFNINLNAMLYYNNKDKFQWNK